MTPAAPAGVGGAGVGGAEVGGAEVGGAEVGGAGGSAGFDWVSGLPFLVLHLAPLALLLVGFGLGDLVLAVVLYVTRMFFITAGYHRYFAHRSYRLSRPVQLVMAIGGVTAAQKGPLWWASHHRRHHRSADTTGDPHTPNDGWWWCHVGWVLSHQSKRPDPALVTDLARFPELRFVDRYQAAGPWLLAGLCFAAAGWGGLVAFAVSTVALWHATFAVNSVAHRLGRRRYETPDTSRNCWPVALITFGEGWHNNHHHYPPSARQGHRWWELDVTYMVLRAMAAIHLLSDLRKPTARALAARPARTLSP
ncbi:MAG: acyl-CoA desaturase [Acidimicrobiales bacterium]